MKELSLSVTLPSSTIIGRAPSPAAGVQSHTSVAASMGYPHLARGIESVVADEGEGLVAGLAGAGVDRGEHDEVEIDHEVGDLVGGVSGIAETPRCD